MKKLYLTCLTLLTCGAAYALPIGNPADASLLCDGIIWEGYCGDPCDPCLTWCDAFSFRLGFYGDYVFNRHLEREGRFDDDIEHTEMNTNAALLVGNFWDRFDIFATLGATNIRIESNEKSFGVTGTGRFVIQTETDFSWSIGVRGTVWECGCTTFGAEAQYFFTKPHITRVTRESQFSVYPASHLHAKYQEWQFGVGIAHRINLLVPYMGIKWSHAQLDMDNALISGLGGVSATLPDLENKKFFGYAVGVSLVDCEKVSITAEGRFSDEKAFHVNGQIRF